ncbi:MAG: hemin-degrading factor [Saprospiraceae bacterium]|nr:hemin-degrading factor [Saprospiraceae bacterium]
MMTYNTSTELAEKYQALKQLEPGLRIYDAAQRLEVSEMELLQLQLGNGVIRLRDNFMEMLPEVKTFGTVMALTRNHWVVHERKGVYDNVSFVHGGSVGLAVNPDIDLRLFMNRWKYAFAAAIPGGKDRILYSLQFFNPAGEAIHKIYLTDTSDRDAYETFVAKYTHSEQVTLDFKAAPLEVNPGRNSLSPDEIAAFQEHWIRLQDTHDFFPLLKKFNISRTAALRFAPEGYTRQIEIGKISTMLEQAAAQQVPIMVFVENEACIQIHTGEVHKILPLNSWINVMDPLFNLHLNLDGVGEAWITRKPTVDGVVTGVELFDRGGKLLVYFFGKRKPGLPELETWRSLVDAL